MERRSLVSVRSLSVALGLLSLVFVSIWIFTGLHLQISLVQGPIQVIGPVSEIGVREIVEILESTEKASFRQRLLRGRVIDAWNGRSRASFTSIQRISKDDDGLIRIGLVVRRPGRADEGRIHEMEVLNPAWITHPAGTPPK